MDDTDLVAALAGGGFSLIMLMGFLVITVFITVVVCKYCQLQRQRQRQQPQ